MDVARIFGVERSRVGVVGVLHGNSVVVTLKIPRECAEMIPYLVELGIKEYITLDVDKIKLEGQMYDLKGKIPPTSPNLNPFSAMGKIMVSCGRHSSRSDCTERAV